MATPSTTAETSNRGSADVDLERGAEGEGDNHAAAIAPTSTKSTSSDVRNSDESQYSAKAVPKMQLRFRTEQPNLAQRVSRSLKRKRRKLISPLTADVSDDRYDHWKYEARKVADELQSYILTNTNKQWRTTLTAGRAWRHILTCQTTP